MKIAHISDLHISTKGKKYNTHNFRILLSHITNLDYDHVVITGDLTHNADPHDFELTREIFDEFALLDSNKLSLVIGNHDIFGGIHLAEDIITFPNKCTKLDYDKKVKQFGCYFKEVFERTYCPNGKFFPYAKDLGDLVIIGINSIDRYSKFRNPFASNGKISPKEFSGLKEMLNMSEYKEKQKIILIHHHFNKINSKDSEPTFWQRIEEQTMKLREKKKILSLFNNKKIAVVLHGHVHTISDYERKNIRFVNAGAAIEGKDEHSLNYNEIILDHEKITVNCLSIPKYKSTIQVNQPAVA